MKKRKILFLIHTEYHMMVALSLIDDLYCNSEKFDIQIYQSSNKKKKRFLFEKEINLLDNLSYKVIKYNERSNIYNNELVSFINNTIEIKYDVFIMFNHHMFVPVYLAKKLYKNGTEVCLAPDGLKAYNESNKITPRWSIQDAISFIRFLRVNKLSYTFHFPTLTYANLNAIKKVFVPFPSKYNNRTNKEVRKVNLMGTEKSNKMVKAFFKFDVLKELTNTKKVIFYVNQPVINDSIYKYEIEVLKSLQKKFIDYKLIVKLHPLTDAKQVEKIYALNNVEVITKSYPAELYIAALQDSIVISFWSTACLVNNKNIRIYWLFPALVKQGIMLNYVKITNPTEHIIEVENIHEIN